MSGFLLVVLGYFALWTIIRLMASAEIYFCFIPANTIGYVTEKKNVTTKVGDGSKATPATGGDIINILHAVPGKRVFKKDKHDNRTWEMVQGRQIRNLWHLLFRVHTLGMYNSLRVNTVREFRISIDEKEQEEKKELGNKADPSKNPEPVYRVHAKSYPTKFVFFSREHAVRVKKAETLSGFALELLFNILYEETFPVRARLEVADSNSVLTTLIDRSANALTSAEEANYFLFGNMDHKHDLEEKVCTEVSTKALESLGITVKKVILDSLDPDELTRQLFELKKRQQMEGEAAAERQKQEIETVKNVAQQAIERARGTMEAQKLINKGDADRVTTVYTPIALNPEMVRLREAEVAAEAYKANQVVTTFAPGNGKVTPTIQLTK